MSWCRADHNLHVTRKINVAKTVSLLTRVSKIAAVREYKNAGKSILQI